MTWKKFWKRVNALIHDNRTALREGETFRWVRSSAKVARGRIKMKEKNKKFSPRGFYASNI